MRVSKTAQLRVATPDKPGELSRVLNTIASANVNVIAFAGYARDNQGHIMIVPDNAGKAATLLKSAGYDVKDEPVVVVTDSDVLGSGAALAAKIAKAGINLSGSYATSAGGTYVTVFQTAEIDRLVAALK